MLEGAVRSLPFGRPAPRTLSLAFKASPAFPFFLLRTFPVSLTSAFACQSSRSPAVRRITATLVRPSGFSSAPERAIYDVVLCRGRRWFGLPRDLSGVGARYLMAVTRRKRTGLPHGRDGKTVGDLLGEHPETSHLLTDESAGDGVPSSSCAVLHLPMTRHFLRSPTSGCAWPTPSFKRSRSFRKRMRSCAPSL